jgi:predicted AlkP superfamily pyrophosphatase or phosphodiesterase
MTFRAQNTLHTVDVFAKDLHDSLAARNLTDIVDIIFVSDHGMTETINGRSIDMVYLDDILGEEYNNIEHEDGQHYILSIRDKNSNVGCIYQVGLP